MTAQSPLLPIQQAVYKTLSEASDLGAPVFDEVPEPAPRPYVEIGEAYETPDNTHDGFGRETLVTVHVWSDQKGFTEAHTILNRIINLLDHQPLTVEGFQVISVRYVYGQTAKDSDKRIRQVSARFSITTAQTSS